MTVSTTTAKASASANGTQHSFAYGFKIFADADLKVTVRAADGTETLKTLNTHYIVTNAGSSSGGNVLFKFNTGTSSDAHFSSTDQRPQSGETVVIKRELTLTQGTDYVANDPFPAESHEDALDRLTFISQQQQEELDRTIKASVTNTISGAEFALSATDRANKIFAFDGSGDLSITQELGTFKGNWAASTDYVVRDIVKDSGTNNIFIVNEAHTSSGSLPLTTNTNSAKYDLIVDAASATTSQTAAAASASTASTQATNSANSATASANSATASANSATSAAASLTTFQGQYHGAASSDPSSNLDTGDLYFNTSTGIKVYTGSAWEDVKPSSSEQTNINSVASNATNINTVAGANTNITTVASNISGVNSFAERYRVASSDPSSSLDEGDLAFNTTSNLFKFYNGSAWVSIAPGISELVEDTSPQLGGTLDVNGNTIDMNGNELILDVDGDTSITADTDDQIDFKVGGADKASLTSSSFNIDVDVALQTDSAKIAFGADGDITLTHDPDNGLLLKNTNTADGNPARLVLETGETAVETGDNLGQISFRAPDEADGTDAIVKGVTIAAVAESDFASASNETSLRFLTASSGTATSKMAIRSDGNVGVGTNSPTFTYGGGIEIERADSATLRLQRTGSTASALELSADDGLTRLDTRSSVPMAFSTGGTERARITGTTGHLCIGRTGTSSGAEEEGIVLLSNGSIYSARDGTSAQNHFVIINNAASTATIVGRIQSSSSSTSYITSSDYRLKENIVDLTGAIDRVKTLAPKRFNFIVDKDTIVDGFLAHEVTAVPEAISGTKDETEAIGDLKDADGNVIESKTPKPETLEDNYTWTETGTRPVHQGIDQSKLVPLLTAALQEAIAKIETLETKVAALEG